MISGPVPPPPPPIAQNFANAALVSGGGTGLLGTDDLRSSLLSEIKAAGGSGSRGLRRVRPEGTCPLLLLYRLDFGRVCRFVRQ